MDNVSKQKRSETMRAIKSQDSKIEILFRKKLWKLGARYRKNPKNFFGKPDLANSSKKIVIFIDSCFWHGCPKHCRMPTANRDYWQKKIERNKKRDKEVNKYYRKNGWRLFRVWEHEIKDSKKLKFVINKISKFF